MSFIYNYNYNNYNDYIKNIDTEKFKGNLHIKENKYDLSR